MISSSVKLVRRNVITAAQPRNLGPFLLSNGPDHRPDHFSRFCKRGGLSFFDSRLCSNLSKPVIQKAAKESDEENELREIIKPAKLTFKSGTEYSDTFRRLLRLELDHELLHKSDGEQEKDIRKRFDSQLKALQKFARNDGKLNAEIYQVILGKRKIDRPKSEDQQLDLSAFCTPSPIRLNRSQAFAIKQSLENCFTLIQGPPGSGKSQTATAIVYHLSRSGSAGRKKAKREQILVCANSNNVCDDLALKISKFTGLKVVRMVSERQVQSYSSNFSVHQIIKEPGSNSKLANFLELTGDDESEMLESDRKRYNLLRERYLNRLLDEADVICTTCSMAGAGKLARKRFKILVLDEAAACTEAELIGPLNKGVQKLVLIGDFQQLPPVIKSQTAAENGLERSLMERLVSLGNYYVMLDTQYRMHPLLSRFPSERFYGGLLKNGVSEKDRAMLDSTFEWPTSGPALFYSCDEPEQELGHSYLNREQAVVIARLVARLVDSGIRPSQIGIITPYVGHREHLRASLKLFRQDIDHERIEIESINAYQGREKDIIILSTVRSNEAQGKRSIGFLRDARRLNVALTRARCGLIIVGSEKTLVRDENWKELITFYRENGLIIS